MPNEYEMMPNLNVPLGRIENREKFICLDLNIFQDGVSLIRGLIHNKVDGKAVAFSLSQEEMRQLAAMVYEWESQMSQHGHRAATFRW